LDVFFPDKHREISCDSDYESVARRTQALIDIRTQFLLRVRIDTRVRSCTRA